MKGFLVLISILFATFLFFPSSIQARQLAAEHKYITPGTQKGKPACSRRGRYTPGCLPKGSPPRPPCNPYKRKCSP